jgi:DNA-binding transcriptional regulator YbjK
MVQAYQTEAGTGASPRGAARRNAILRAAIELIGDEGSDALTHRAVAERARVPLSATTYYFTSKEDLFEEAVALAADEEAERFEQLVLELAPRALTAKDWAREIAAAIAADIEAEPARPMALFEFGLAAVRRAPLRAEVARWEKAHLRLAELGLRAAGSNNPQTDAIVVVATIRGLVLAQFVTPRARFEQDVLRPALERLFDRLTS